LVSLLTIDTVIGIITITSTDTSSIIFKFPTKVQIKYLQHTGISTN